MALKSMPAQGNSLLSTNFEKLSVTCSVRLSRSSFDEAISLFKRRRRRKICFDLGATKDLMFCDSKFTGIPELGSPPIVYEPLSKDLRFREFLKIHMHK